MERSKAMSIDSIRQSVLNRAMTPIPNLPNQSKSKFCRLKVISRFHAHPGVGYQEPLKGKITDGFDEAKSASEKKKIVEWKGLFKEKLQKTIQKRKADCSGCRPGWFCFNKPVRCEVKKFIVRDRADDYARLASKSRNESAEEFLIERNITWLIEQILLSYEFLKSLDYSDMKVSHLVKAHCLGDSQLIYVFLKSNGHKQSRNHDLNVYIRDKDTLINNIVMVASNNKLSHEVEDFYYNIKQFKARLEADVVQRSKNIASMMSTGISNTRRQLSKQFRLTTRQKPFKDFQYHLQKLQRRCGPLNRITPLNRQICAMLTAEQLLLLQQPQEEQF